MRENWDYVTFDTYSKDMRESTDRATAVIGGMKERAERAERMLALIVLTVGKVEISDHDLADIRPVELTQWRNDADMKYILEARRTSHPS